MTSYGVIVLLALAALSACNTVEGVGRDIRTLGNTIEDSAEKNRR